MGDGQIVGVGEGQVDPSDTAAARQSRGAAMQPDPRRAERRADDLDVRPSPTTPVARSERLEEGLLRGEAGGQGRDRPGESEAVFAFRLGEEAREGTLAVPGEEPLDAGVWGEVGSDAEDHGGNIGPRVGVRGEVVAWPFSCTRGAFETRVFCVRAAVPPRSRAMMYPVFLLLLLNLAPDNIASTSVVSPRAPVSAEVEDLRSDLSRLIASPGWSAAEWGVLVVSLDRGDTLFAHRPDAALAPASNLKLFTSAAALYYLGPSFRYSTYLVSAGRMVSDTLVGDLIVYGTGDPTISDRIQPTKTAVWEALADSLIAQGIRVIAGDVVGDASYFGETSAGRGWKESYMNTWYAAPASALSFNENIVTLFIRPGEAPGWRPRIQLVPGGQGIAIVNQATTVSGGQTRISVDRAAYDGPIVVRGRISAGSSGVWSAVPVEDPARFAAAVVREVLQSKGIEVLGGVRSVHASDSSAVTGRKVFAPAFSDRPVPRVLAVHRSPPMQEILNVVNQRSHNLFSEDVLRTVGRVVLGVGTVEAGERAVHFLLECETRGPTETLRMFDGSGLSVLNRVDARTTIRLLAYMAKSPHFESYFATLPVAGVSRGLRRMHRTAAEANLRAKTGTIDSVSALSGYVRAANGELLAFSIMSNNVPSTWRAKRVEDAIGARIAAFTRPAAPTPAATRLMQPVAGPPAPSASDSSGATTPGPRQHVIRKGDTLEGIAKRYGTTVRALEAANPGIEPRRLIPGRRVNVP